MSIWVKICGLTRAADVAAAAAARADAIGFVFHAASPRNVTPALARSLADPAPRSLLRVAVVRHPAQGLIDEILAVFAPDVLQADLVDITTLALPRELGLLPVLRCGQPQPAALPTRCLVEGARSGVGERADWAEAAALARRTQVVLAGGLDAANVAEAVRCVRPFGVDVSSGVESVPGIKDQSKIDAFLSAARAVPPAGSMAMEQKR